MGVLKREGRRANFRGGMTPYIFILVGFVYLILTPFTDKGLKRDIGQLAENNKSSYSKFTLVGTKEPFIVQNKKNKAILEKVLPNARDIEVWTRKISLKKGSVMQLKIDGRMVIEYNWWHHAKAPIIFIVIGLILLPIVRKKWKEVKSKGEV